MEEYVETRTTTTTASSSSSSSHLNNKATRAKAFAPLTSDYSSDDMTPEAKRKQLSNNKGTASTKSTVTTMFTNTSKRLGNAINARLTAAATSTPRSQLETTQNLLNLTQEQHQRSAADWSQDHLAYIEYRDAGEYWK